MAAVKICMRCMFKLPLSLLKDFSLKSRWFYLQNQNILLRRRKTVFFWKESCHSIFVVNEKWVVHASSVWVWVQVHGWCLVSRHETPVKWTCPPKMRNFTDLVLHTAYNSVWVTLMLRLVERDLATNNDSFDNLVKIRPWSSALVPLNWESCAHHYFLHAAANSVWVECFFLDFVD